MAKSYASFPKPGGRAFRLALHPTVLMGAVLAACLGFGTAVQAQSAPTATTGKVTGNGRRSGAASGGEGRNRFDRSRGGSRATTDAAGAFEFDAVPPGSYRLDITKAGFAPLQDTIVVTAGATATSKLQLAAASLNSIREIGRTAVVRNSANALNTSTAAVATISGSSFIDQGQLNVNRVLNELPGVQIGVGSHFAGDGEANGSSPIVTGIPQIRGSLPYETESLIDGHPISIGALGTFNPAFINPYILDDVEVVKGPGASAPNINYAIGGTVNFRTLEPTRTMKQSVDLGIDQFGGENINLRTTGTLAVNSGTRSTTPRRAPKASTAVSTRSILPTSTRASSSTA